MLCWLVIKLKFVLWKYQSKARLFVWVCCRQLCVKKNHVLKKQSFMCLHCNVVVNVWLLTCFTRKGLASFYKRSRSIEQGFIYMSKVSNSPEIFFSTFEIGTVWKQEWACKSKNISSSMIVMYVKFIVREWWIIDRSCLPLQAVNVCKWPPFQTDGSLLCRQDRSKEKLICN